MQLLHYYSSKFTDDRETLSCTIYIRNTSPLRKCMKLQNVSKYLVLQTISHLWSISVWLRWILYNKANAVIKLACTDDKIWITMRQFFARTSYTAILLVAEFRINGISASMFCFHFNSIYWLSQIRYDKGSSSSGLSWILSLWQRFGYVIDYIKWNTVEVDWTKLVIISIQNHYYKRRATAISCVRAIFHIQLDLFRFSNLDGIAVSRFCDDLFVKLSILFEFEYLLFYCSVGVSAVLHLFVV